MRLEVVGWLASNALPISGVAAGDSVVDLQPLKEILRDVRVVGLGEATHGTREFFQLKHRLLEFLVAELGFSTFAMEASASAGVAVDAYVRRGEGDAEQVLRGLGFWTWRTREVLAMFEWMRAYNRRRPEEAKLRFVGVDPQNAAASVRAVDDYLSTFAPDRVAAFRATLGVLAGARPGSLPAAQRPDLTAASAELVADLATLRAVPADVVRHARILQQVADVATRPRQHEDPARTVFAARDRYMADGVADLLLADPTAKVALWAHNTHLAKRARSSAAAPPLGQHLHERFGTQYYALALLFGTGSFRALQRWPWQRSSASRAPAKNTVRSPDPTTVEAHLSAACPTAHLLDLRAAADAPAAVRTWMNSPTTIRSVGAQVTPWSRRSAQTTTTLGRDYDGLAYLPDTTCSRPLPA